jgi:hypothetical protein
MITYEFANREPGWMRVDLANKLSDDAYMMVKLSREYGQPELMESAISLYNLSCLVYGIRSAGTISVTDEQHESDSIGDNSCGL